MIYHSPYPDLEIPQLPLTQVAMRHAERLAEKPALIDATTGRTMTYGELERSIERAAAGFHECGVRQHNVVAILAQNSIEYVISFHAIVSLGAIVSTISPQSLENDIERQLNHHRARFLVVADSLCDLAEQASRNLPVQEVFVIGEHSRLTTLDSLLSCQSPVPTVRIAPGEDIAVLLCSSGTTGLPKGVMLTHRAVISMGLMMTGPDGIKEDDVLPGQLPLFHAFGVMVTMSAGLATGATSVLLTQPDFGQFLRLVHDYRATRAYAAPPTLVQLAKNPLVDDFDLSSMRVILSGAAPLGADVEQIVRQRVGSVVKQGYGMTECVPILHAPDDIPLEKQGSVGFPVPNTEVRIVDPDTGLDCRAHQPGEIWARGPQSMSGYLDDPAATAATRDADGWIHTGDIGYVDEDGYFYIVDRLKELIKYKGYQVAPAELEAILLTHPAVADAAVVRYPDDDAGEIPKAFVVARAPVEADELMAWVAERVAPYKKVRMVEFIDVIPKSPSGKILRRELIARDRQPTPVLV